MRFDKETRTLIYEAAPYSTTIRWPAGAPEPEKGRVYWMQSLEDAEREKARADYSPDTHADVMARMHLARYHQWPEGYKPPKAKAKRRKPDDVIQVLDVTILDRGWEARVALFEDPDPKRHTGLKTKVPSGQNPIDKFQEKTELEPEEMIVPKSRRQREEEDEALKLEHRTSVDHAELAKAERHLAGLRQRGKRCDLAEQAAERARRRVEQSSAAGGA